MHGCELEGPGIQSSGDAFKLDKHTWIIVFCNILMMEKFITEYIAKHSSDGIFDGIENAVDEPYEWATSCLENNPKMIKDEEKLANAIQALLVYYKLMKE